MQIVPDDVKDFNAECEENALPEVGETIDTCQPSDPAEKSIEELQNEIADLKLKLSESRDEVSHVKSKLKESQEEVSRFKSKLNGRQAEEDCLKLRIKELSWREKSFMNNDKKLLHSTGIGSMALFKLILSRIDDSLDAVNRLGLNNFEK